MFWLYDGNFKSCSHEQLSQKHNPHDSYYRNIMNGIMIKALRIFCVQINQCCWRHIVGGDDLMWCGNLSQSVEKLLDAHSSCSTRQAFELLQMLLQIFCLDSKFIILTTTSPLRSSRILSSPSIKYRTLIFVLYLFFLNPPSKPP